MYSDIKINNLIMFSVRYLLPILLLSEASKLTEKCLETSKPFRISTVPIPGRPRITALFLHGESPVWDPRRECLVFVDVKKRNVHRLDYATGKIYSKHIGYGDVNVVSLVERSSRVAVAVRSSLYLMDWDVPGDDALRLLTTVDLGLPDNVINEGKPDAVGRYWAGTKGPQVGEYVFPDKATFYSIEQECIESPRIQIRPVSISNGLVWSLNNTILYYIDSPTKRVQAYEFNLQTGDIRSPRTIINVASLGYKNAIPDGMTIDKHGNLWVALIFGGSVLHVNPDNRSVIFAYKLPVTHVTSVSWGGPHLDVLYVTTARDKVNTTLEPLAGAIFKIQDTGCMGVEPYYFKFNDADNY